MPNLEHGFNDMAYSLLFEAISDSDTTMVLPAGGAVSFLPGWQSGRTVYLTLTNIQNDIEIVKVTEIHDDILTVERGQDGSVSKAWPVGTIVIQRGVAIDFTSFIQKGGFRSIAGDPNGVLAGLYPGEKVYDTDSKSWWINITGTLWKCLAGTCIPVYQDFNPVVETEYTMLSLESSWAAARATETPSVYYSGNEVYRYWAMGEGVDPPDYSVSRTFMEFDLSAIAPGTSVVSATLTIQGYDSGQGDYGPDAHGDVVVQQGQQSTPPVAADFNAYTGPYFGRVTWTVDTYFNPSPNIFTFNATGINYLESILGGNAKFCLRGYDRDYLNVAPGATKREYWNGMYFTLLGHPEFMPVLRIYI